MVCALRGISLEAATQLFAARNANAEANHIYEAYKLTDGHAFWLDLMAIQSAQGGTGTSLIKLVDEIRSGGSGLLPEKTLQSIWSKLKEREQLILRAMAETVKPDTEAEIGEYLKGQLNYNKVIKGLKALRALNLVVVKRRSKTVDLLELHPLVRQFIRGNFKPTERISFIQAILAVYQDFIGAYRPQLSQRPSLAMLQRWTQSAELDIAAGRFEEAFAMLAEVAAPFQSTGHTREFCRVARLLLSVSNWMNDHARFKGFHKVFRAHVSLLSYLGDHKEVDELLEKFERTVSNRDVRYIGYAEMKAHSKWLKGDYSAAVEWGRIGSSLATSSGVDTDIEIAHTLALAERDAGQPELALSTFLHGEQLAKIIDPDDLDETRGGAFYGNIGRCLQFMGQVDSALVCYQKSALMVERDPTNEHIFNQGYIRAWIGELLVAREQAKLAAVFYRAAAAKWRQVYPLKATRMAELARQLEGRFEGRDKSNDATAERVCLDWILGRDIDSEYR